MGYELAAAHPGGVTFQAIPGADHMSILGRIDLIRSAMAAVAAATLAH